MEQKLGRQLDPNKETVDHIDRDVTNDNIENLRVVPRGKHTKEDCWYVERKTVTCCGCGKEFSRIPSQLSDAARQKKAGPFCSKQCAGRYSARVQHGLTNKLPSQKAIPKHKRRYYKKQKSL
jgi:hypothetical protein